MKMQVLPLLTPTHYTPNNKKRSRDSVEDDFESHYLKKRLISTLPDNNNNINNNNMEKKPSNDNVTNNNTIHLLDINGTLLPMEQRPGETKYSIPGFVLSSSSEQKPIHTSPSSGQLILYQENPILANIHKQQAGIEDEVGYDEDDDTTTTTSEENDEEFEPMDLD